MAYYVNDTVIGFSLNLYGEYGQKEIDFLRWVVNDQYVIYDVGANIGVYSTALSDTAKQIFCFEPNQRNFQLLSHNTADLANVHCYNLACGQYNGTTHIMDFDPDVHGNFGNLSNGDQGIPVPLIALDALDIPAPNLLKIDVEGAELEVLLGCENKIRSSLPCIVYEAHETKQFAEIYDFLSAVGYKLFWLQCPNFNVQNFKQNYVNVFGNTVLYSVIAWPPGWPDALKAQPVLDRNDSAKRFSTDKSQDLPGA